MKSIPKVSIIIPNYNHARYLKQRIDSILDQDFQDFEIIILDDCSLDDSRALINSYSNDEKIKKCIFNSKNSGSTFKQWKKGIQSARGEYICIAESDDFCSSAFLSVLVRVLDENLDVGVAYCRSNVVDEYSTYLYDEGIWFDVLDSKRWKNSFFNNGLEHIKSYLQDFNTIPNASAVIFRRNLFSLKDIPVQFKYMGDWYFWILLLLRSNVYYHSTPLNYFRSSLQTTRSEQSELKTIKSFQEMFMIKRLLYRIQINDFTRLALEKSLKELVNHLSFFQLIFSTFFWRECVMKHPFMVYHSFKHKYLQ